jgi:lauroyl/myristoyl acyltransferase
MAAFRRDYLRRGRRTVHGTRLIGPDEAASLPDNSAEYENWSYRYAGLEPVKEMVAARIPVLFVGWHNGAINHLDYSIARVLPEVAIFSRYTFQYGRVFAYPMLGGGALSLLRLDRFLREGRPALIHIDGPPEGPTVELPLLGVPANFATGAIRVVRRIDGVRIVPVTSYWRSGDTIEVAFHLPVPEPARLADMSERDIIAALLACLEDDLRRNAPEQVVLEYIPYREALARTAAGRGEVTKDPAKT